MLEKMMSCVCDIVFDNRHSSAGEAKKDYDSVRYGGTSVAKPALVKS